MVIFCQNDSPPDLHKNKNLLISTLYHKKIHLFFVVSGIRINDILKSISTETVIELNSDEVLKIFKNQDVPFQTTFIRENNSHQNAGNRLSSKYIY